MSDEHKPNTDATFGLIIAAFALIGVPLAVNALREPPPLVKDGAKEYGDIVRDVDDYWRATFKEHFPNAPVAYESPSVVFKDQIQAPFANVFEPAGLYTPRFQQIKIKNDHDYGWVAHVIAHEFGHHVQNLAGLGVDLHETDAAKTRNVGQDVLYELQADCLAGVWAADASEAGQVLTKAMVERHRKREAISMDSVTHGSSADRFEWFDRGYKSGDASKCLGKQPKAT